MTGRMRGYDRLQGDQERDLFAVIRENKEAVEVVTERDNKLGAAALVWLALADGDQPTADDLRNAGFL